MATIDVFQGRARIWDDSGALRFDSNDGTFHILNAVNGSRSFGGRNVTITFNNPSAIVSDVTDYNIGAVDPACDAIFGSIRCSYGSGGNGGLPANAYFAISGGGTYVHVADGFDPPNERSGYVRQLATYTFTLRAGGATGRYVNLRERVYLNSNWQSIPSGRTVSYGFDAFTMLWRLRVGRFT